MARPSLKGPEVSALIKDRIKRLKEIALTGIAAADFSRIRNADLGRFTVDRLMSIINRLGSRIEVAVNAGHTNTADAAYYLALPEPLAM